MFRTGSSQKTPPIPSPKLDESYDDLAANSQSFSFISPSEASPENDLSSSRSFGLGSAPVGSSSSPHKIRFGRTTPTKLKKSFVNVRPGAGIGHGAPGNPSQQATPAAAGTSNPALISPGAWPSSSGGAEVQNAPIRQSQPPSPRPDRGSPVKRRRTEHHDASDDAHSDERSTSALSASIMKAFKIKPRAQSPVSSGGGRLRNTAATRDFDFDKPQPARPSDSVRAEARAAKDDIVQGFRPPHSSNRARIEQNDFARSLKEAGGETLQALCLLPFRITTAVLTLPTPILSALIVLAVSYFSLAYITHILPTPSSIISWLIPTWLRHPFSSLSALVPAVPACASMPIPLSWACHAVSGSKTSDEISPDQVARVASELGVHARRAQTVFQSVMGIGRETGLALHHTEVWEMAYAVKASNIEDKDKLANLLKDLGDRTMETKDNLIDINARGVSAFEWIVQSFDRVELILDRMHAHHNGPPTKSSILSSLSLFASPPPPMLPVYTRKHLSASLDTLFTRLSTELNGVVELIEKAIPVAARASASGGVVLERFETEKGKLQRERETAPLWKYLMDSSSWRGSQTRRDVELTTTTVKSLRSVRKDLENSKEFLRTFRNHISNFKAGMVGYRMGNDQLDPMDEVQSLKGVMGQFREVLDKAKKGGMVGIDGEGAQFRIGPGR